MISSCTDNVCASYGANACFLVYIPYNEVVTTTMTNGIVSSIITPTDGSQPFQLVGGKLQYLDSSLVPPAFVAFPSSEYQNVSLTVLTDCDDNSYVLELCPSSSSRPMIVGNQSTRACAPYYDLISTDNNGNLGIVPDYAFAPACCGTNCVNCGCDADSNEFLI